MWKLLEQAAKTATANASEYVSTVQEKAQSLVATVQDEAATLLHAIGSARTGPVDELLYEEMDDYKVFCESFAIDSLTDEISQILEQDDEIRGLHEQMVPVQLSYEEFWSRYFFRREQEEIRQQREDERKKKLREQAEAKAAAKAVLEEFEVDEEDEEEFVASTATRDVTGADDANDDVDDSTQRKLVDKADGEEAEATLAQLREIRASRRAAQQWKQKAFEYQKQLGVLAARNEEDKEKVKASMEAQYQSLCDTYETKMAAATTQIDDARAMGYQEGIEESEAIVSAMRQEADNEINRLKMEIAQLRQRDPSAVTADGNVSLGELDRLMDALTLKEELVAALEEKNTELEQKLLEKEKTLQQAVAASSSVGDGSSLAQENAELKQALATLQAQLAEATASASGNEMDQVKKEMELWKVRAIKMKKAKEQVEAELQQLTEQQNTLPAPAPAPESSSEEVAALRLKVVEMERANEMLTSELTAKLEAVSKQEFERGAISVRGDLEAQIEQLRLQVAQAQQRGEETAAAKYKSDTELLRMELSVLRAERQAASALGAGSDVLAQADAVLSSLSSPPSSASMLDGSNLLDDPWTSDSDAAPAKPDWGEW